ncbi:MAG: NAD(P)H-dependent oxidoreductase subunit E [Candidatus Aminicenantes bacterium]
MEKIFKKFHPERKELIHILHEVQSENGYISPEAIADTARFLHIPESEIYGILTFYRAFTLTPRGEHIITICMGTACHVRGAPRILDEFSRRLEIKAGETSEDGEYTLETVNCVGACALGPIVITDGEYHGEVKSKDLQSILKQVKQEKESG